MELNNKLVELYERHWSVFSSELNKINSQQVFAMPFLLDLSQSLDDKFKIVIYGQETWGWHDGQDLENWIAKGMDGYKNFFWERKFYTGYGKSSFWQAFRFFEKNIPKMLKAKGIEKEPIFIWNNISKLGLSNNSTGVSETGRKLERDFFKVIQDEYNIIQPDLVIFLTGPNRDHDIKFNFNSPEFSPAIEKYSQRKMAKIKLENTYSLRLYHPAYFSGFTKEYKKDALFVVESLIGEVAAVK